MYKKILESQLSARTIINSDFIKYIILNKPKIRATIRVANFGITFNSIPPVFTGITFSKDHFPPNNQ